MSNLIHVLEVALVDAGLVLLLLSAHVDLLSQVLVDGLEVTVNLELLRELVL